MNKKAMLVVWAMLVCGAWLQPNHFPPWLSFHSEALVFIAFAVGFAALLATRRVPVDALVLGVPEGAFGAMAAVVLFQFLLGSIAYGGDAVIFILYLLGMVFATCAGRALGTKLEVMHALAWAVLIAGLCSTAIAVLQSLLPDSHFTFINLVPGWRRPGANMGQANHLGTLALWAMGSAVYLHLHKKISAFLGVMLGLYLLMGVAISESRTALMGIWALSFWVLIAPAQWSGPRRFVVSIGFAAVGALLFWGWPAFIVGFHEGGWGSTGGEGGSVNTQAGARFVVWPQLLSAVMERPYMGWGVGGVSKALNAILDTYPEGYPFTYAHNLVIDSMIGFGVPVTILLFGVAGYWCWSRCRTLRNLNDWHASALLMPFVLHSMLEFPFAYAYFLLPACFAIGVLEAGRSNVVMLHLPRRVVFGVLIAWLLVGAVVVRDYMLAEEDFRVARFEALKVGHTPKDYTQPHLWILNQLDAMNVATRIVPTPEMEGESLELLRKASSHFPWPAIQRRYALALALNGNVPEARRQLKVMRAMHGAYVYASIRGQWDALAEEKYPQLKGLAPP